MSQYPLSAAEFYVGDKAKRALSEIDSAMRSLQRCTVLREVARVAQLHVDSIANLDPQVRQAKQRLVHAAESKADELVRRHIVALRECEGDASYAALLPKLHVQWNYLRGTLANSYRKAQAEAQRVGRDRS
jgi:hypothetical protein